MGVMLLLGGGDKSPDPVVGRVTRMGTGESANGQAIALYVPCYLKHKPPIGPKFEFV